MGVLKPGQGSYCTTRPVPSTCTGGDVKVKGCRKVAQVASNLLQRSAYYAPQSNQVPRKPKGTCHGGGRGSPRVRALDGRVHERALCALEPHVCQGLWPALAGDGSQHGRFG